MIKGKRVVLRAVEREDAWLIWRWNNDPEVQYFSEGEPARTASLEEIAREREQAVASDTARSFMIETADGFTIGHLGYFNLSWKNRNCWIFVTIGEKEHWGKGYGTESLALLLDYLFNQLGLHKVRLETLSYNVRAQASYRKCGFQVEGTDREARFVDGRWYDMIQMGILASEFRASQSELGTDRGSPSTS
ncbi:MAG: GNAT family N-acetyltransferase [Chloroflexi bacterium]|nr:GNAT family N-acetyltransferase [Chloroflexota bacterium]